MEKMATDVAITTFFFVKRQLELIFSILVFQQTKKNKNQI